MYDSSLIDSILRSIAACNSADAILILAFNITLGSTISANIRLLD